VKPATVQNTAWTEKHIKYASFQSNTTCLLFNLVATSFGHSDHHQANTNSMDCVQVQLGDNADTSDFSL
jgi:hypothetical protein